MHDLLENHLMVVIINVSVSVNGVRVDRVAFGVAFVALVVVSPPQLCLSVLFLTENCVSRSLVNVHKVYNICFG